MPSDRYQLQDLNGFRVYRGAAVRSSSDTVSEYLKDALFLISTESDTAGKIVAAGPTAEIAAREGLPLDSIEKSEGLLLPAFFDTHFHWVQDDVREMPKTSLIEWLEQFTFPEEAKYGDREFAKAKAAFFWQRILSVGTVGGLCYSSIHEVALVEALAVAPADFRIGNVLMTMNCPDAIRQTEAEAIRSVEACASRWGERYVCSPRFAPTTAPSVLEASAVTAARHGCFQQTHLCETREEIAWVLDIYSQIQEYQDVDSYLGIYERAGMLSPQTVFGHCIYLSDREWELMADTGSRIASCPTSNAPIDSLGLGSGLFDFEKAESCGVPWSLASDIGGGPFLSMFDVMESFVAQNAAVGRGAATYTKALHRSTFRGAELMDLSKDRGMLVDDYFFDAIRVPMPDGFFEVGDGEAVISALVQGIPRREATDAFVLETFVKGNSRFKKGESF